MCGERGVEPSGPAMHAAELATRLIGNEWSMALLTRFGSPASLCERSDGQPKIE